MERLRPESAWTETFRGMLAALRGNPGPARVAIERLKKRGESGELTVFFEGFVHFALGEQDAFVQCLEEAFRLHSLPLFELLYARVFEPARRDPRILDLLRRQAELRMHAA